jgi:hypothetical protein
MPPPPPKHVGSYPEDREREDDESFIDSSLSVGEVVAWIANEAPGGMVDNLDDEEDGGVDRFCHDDSRRPVLDLEPFDTRFATSSWTRWDGTASDNVFKDFRYKILLISNNLKKIDDNSLSLAADPQMTDDTWPKIRRADPLMTMTIRVGRDGTVFRPQVTSQQLYTSYRLPPAKAWRPSRCF